MSTHKICGAYQNFWLDHTVQQNNFLAQPNGFVASISTNEFGWDNQTFVRPTKNCSKYNILMP